MTEPRKASSVKEREENSAENPHRFALIIALALIGIVAVAGCAAFLFFWHKGNEKAEAFSGLLAFLAAIASSIVTVVFIYLTSASLQKAQASINLQREELEQIKSSVDLQRREWEQKVRVFPQFWITTTENTTIWFMPDPRYPGGSQRMALKFNKRFMLRVWNYSEQSFLIESVRIHRSDVGMVPNQQSEDVQIVVTPHSVGEEDVSYLVMPVLTQSFAGNQPANIMMNDLDKSARIFVRLVYSDWSQKHAETEIREFELTYRPGDADVAIRVPPSASVTTPSI